ncbi:MAG: LacI family DNA-binding transcriptional regulator [Verrucomicrobia bacterium]|nr:LacI family DNA-binding transcriptional regulator [Verrucomicrobiota bacterium]
MKIGVVTQKDVARKAGVSPATVSHVLGNRPGFAYARNTRFRVFDAARELRYVPNLVSASLRKQRTWTIGLILPALDNAIVIRKFDIIEREFRRAGYHVLMGLSRGEVATERTYLDGFYSRRVDGVVIFPMLRNGEIEHLRRLMEAQFPSVIVGEHEDSEGLDFSYVDVNREQGHEMAVQHLIEHGHHRIGFIFPRFEGGGRRRRGAERALRTQGLPLEERWIRHVEKGSFAEALPLARSLLGGAIEASPTAIVCSGGSPAAAVLRAAQETGLAIPKDLALVSFGDDDLAVHGPTLVTTVSHCEEAVGTKACEELIRLIEQPDAERRHISVEPKLILRNSCGCEERQNEK